MNKQETLEEAAERAYSCGLFSTKTAFIAGAKWQQEQCKKDLDAHLDVAENLWLQVVKQNKKLYSEEEVYGMLQKLRLGFKVGVQKWQENFEFDLEEWFEQFKKK
jgi:hypothetical protein